MSTVHLCRHTHSFIMKVLLKKFLSKALIKTRKKCKDGRREEFLENKTDFKEKESRKDSEVIKLSRLFFCPSWRRCIYFYQLKCLTFLRVCNNFWQNIRKSKVLQIMTFQGKQVFQNLILFQTSILKVMLATEKVVGCSKYRGCFFMSVVFHNIYCFPRLLHLSTSYQI